MGGKREVLTEMALRQAAAALKKALRQDTCSDTAPLEGDCVKKAEEGEGAAEERKRCPTQPFGVNSPSAEDAPSAEVGCVEPPVQLTSAPKDAEDGAAEGCRLAVGQDIITDRERTGQGSTQRSLLLTSATGKQGDDATDSASTAPRSRLKRGAVKHEEAEDESAQALRAPRKKRMAFTIAQICMQPSESSSEAVSVSEDDGYQDSYEEDDDDDDRGLPLQLAQEEASAELDDLSDADSVTKTQPHTTQDDTISGTKSDGCVPDKSRFRTKPSKLVPDPVVKAVEQAPDADEG
ncbi:hypothetical protein PF005_g8213 [Phytophthora fragariae]|nr:hypothetical protein PF009_g9107 [Phytophthora fragariae]KAE9016446.1 hypothetical protein PF011_g7162 [Phytophthora fragariae]KAE9064911.1 hypothetical protein PF006_g30573 [Phytophthora fragariae]KAE9087529.1 hypothetical protein PF007_g20342 [Phytophthora fragariae]KAE9201070.1 hypothetical protein PF002_g21648 [Phytophthora fragariae]